MNTAVLRWHMANGDKGVLNGSTIERLSRWGPAWLLVFVMVGGLGYGLYRVMDQLVPALTSYVTASRTIDEQNAKHVAVLLTAQEKTSGEHEAMLSGMRTLQSAIELRHEEHQGQTARIDQMLALIESAVERMKDVPQQRQEELRLLGEIKTGIEQLKNSVEANGHETDY